MTRTARFATLLALAPLAAGAEVVTYSIEAPFDEVAFDLRLAIEERGFVIDAISHVGEMLNRTAQDVGATGPDLFVEADVYQFCSAIVSRRAMEADLLNIAHCPYGVFLYAAPDAPGTVHVGYRTLPDGAMQEVQSLLDAIARQAAAAD